VYTLYKYTKIWKIPPNDSTHVVGLNSGKVLQEMLGHTSYIIKYVSIHVHIHTHIYATFEKIPPNENTNIVCLKSGKMLQEMWGHTSYIMTYITINISIHTHYIYTIFGKNPAKWQYVCCRSEEWENVEEDAGAYALLYEIYDYT